MPRQKVLVTGGSGFLGQYLVQRLTSMGKEVHILDILEPEIQGNSFIKGDVRDFATCLRATDGVSIVYHNVAQVPLMKNKSLFRSVNILGTRNILEASYINKVEHFVYTSSSAVFGLPNVMPANLDHIESNMFPIEEYGRTKLEGERLVESYIGKIKNTAIVRPRTILGPGRLGLFSVLFEWISEGLDIFVFEGGKHPYQFIHVTDLADGIIAAGNLQNHRVFNLGANNFGLLVEDLTDLCKHAGTGSRIRSISSSLVRKPLLIASKLNLIPFASYQILLYSQPMYFDSNRDWQFLQVRPKYSNSHALIESYDWFVKNRHQLKRTKDQSLHKSLTRGNSLRLIKLFLRYLTSYRA
jgi:nucleoside-diphosphate-sugar epimerase